jgi:hypothetical protein
MEDPDAVTLENRGTVPSGLVRPYVTGQGLHSNRSPYAAAANDEADPWEGYFVAPPGPAANLYGPLTSAEPGDRTGQTSGHPTQLLADRPAAARPRRRAQGSRPKSAGSATLRRSLALVAVGGTAVVAGIVFLALPHHPAGTPMTECKTPGCHASSAAPGSSRPEMSLYARAHNTMSTPASHAATPPTASPAPSNAVKQTFTAPSASPSPSSSSPSLSPGSLISIEATTQCCTTFSIAHDARDDRVVITQVTPDSSQTARAEATWTVRKGLADSSCISFESADTPGYYLWHHNFELFLARDDGSASFASHTTFCPQAGNSGEGYSFEAYNRPGMFIRHFDYIVYLASDGGVLSWDTSTLWRHDTTWKVIRPWA